MLFKLKLTLGRIRKEKTYLNHGAHHILYTTSSNYTQQCTVDVHCLGANRLDASSSTTAFSCHVASSIICLTTEVTHIKTIFLQCFKDFFELMHFQ
jgi:hypothetical protein